MLIFFANNAESQIFICSKEMPLERRNSRFANLTIETWCVFNNAQIVLLFELFHAFGVMSKNI